MNDQGVIYHPAHSHEDTERLRLMREYDASVDLNLTAFEKAKEAEDDLRHLNETYTQSISNFFWRG